MMNIEKLTEEEYQAAMKTINEIREEKTRQTKINEAKKMLDESITMMIYLIGIEQTKELLKKKSKQVNAMSDYISGKIDASREKWIVIMEDNTIKVFDTLLRYSYWYDEISETEKDNIRRVYTTLNEKDRKELKKLNLI